jgi:hypothetical protein
MPPVSRVGGCPASAPLASGSFTTCPLSSWRYSLRSSRYFASETPGTVGPSWRIASTERGTFACPFRFGGVGDEVRGHRVRPQARGALDVGVCVMNAVTRRVFRLYEFQQWHGNWNRTLKSRRSNSGEFRNCCRVLTASPPRVRSLLSAFPAEMRSFYPGTDTRDQESTSFCALWAGLRKIATSSFECWCHG